MEPLVLNSAIDWILFLLVCLGIVSFAVSGEKPACVSVRTSALEVLAE